MPVARLLQVAPINPCNEEKKQPIRLLVGTWLLMICATVLAQDRQARDVSSQPVISGATVACPPPGKNWPPEQSRKMFEEFVSGTVVLGAVTDSCGRITSVVVQKTSGHKLLDEAALKAAREWTLSTAQRARAINGVTPLEVVFRFETLTHAPTPPAAPDWPRTHSHPRYVLVEGSDGYSDAASAAAAIEALDTSSRAVPYPVLPSSFLQLDTANGREFWYFIYNGSKPDVVVRYQPVFDNGEPIVRLTVICDKQPKQCDAIRKLFLKGPDYARAKR